MLVAGAVIVLLILLTALYVAAEFAAVGVRRSRLRRMAEDGHPLAARILPIVDDPRELDRYIAVSQVGITLSSLILGAYGQATLAPRVAPLLQRATNLDQETAESTAAVTVLLMPDGPGDDPRRAGAEVAGAAGPDQSGHRDGAADAVVAAALLVVDRLPERQRAAGPPVVEGPFDGSPSRPLA